MCQKSNLPWYKIEVLPALHWPLPIPYSRAMATDIAVVMFVFRGVRFENDALFLQIDPINKKLFNIFHMLTTMIKCKAHMTCEGEPCHDVQNSVALRLLFIIYNAIGFIGDRLPLDCAVKCHIWHWKCMFYWAQRKVEHNSWFVWTRMGNMCVTSVANRQCRSEISCFSLFIVYTISLSREYLSLISQAGEHVWAARLNREKSSERSEQNKIWTCASIYCIQSAQ